MLSDDLKTNGKPSVAESTGDGNSRQARQVDGDGQDIRKIHLEGILHLLTDHEGRCRRGRGQKRIELLKDSVEIPCDEGSHLLRLPVIGIIISGR